MALTKTPFLSLKASGSLGDTITTQKRGAVSLIRTKPFPAYRQTLPQLYQRWLYKDYAYLWRKQALATQAQYRSAGVKYHLTAFQYWMRECLIDLPYIGGMWHLDEKSGTTAKDFSRNANDGVIYGASPTDGIIDGAFYFDGLNNTISFGPAKFDKLTDCTIEFFASRGAITADSALFSAFKDWNNRISIYFHDADLKLYAYVVVAGAFWGIVSDNPASSSLTHYAIQLGSSGMKLFINATLQVPTNPATSSFSHIAPTISNHIGSIDGTGVWLLGAVDHAVLHNRLLDQEEILRHAERRYPP